MHGKIFVSDIVVQAHIGCTAEERAIPQDLLVNISVLADLSRSISSDDLSDTIDYRQLQAAVLEVAATTTFSLVEKFVDAIADRCLVHAQAISVTVRAEKPHKLPGSKSVGIEIEKSK